MCGLIVLKRYFCTYHVYSAIKQDIDEPTVKKVKKDDVDIELEKKIEKQNKEYFKLRDTLGANTKKPIHISILEANKQAVPEGNSEVLRMSGRIVGCCDIIKFKFIINCK